MKCILYFVIWKIIYKNENTKQDCFITFAVLTLVTGITAIILKRIDLGCLSAICGLVSYVAYKDFKDPEQI